MGLQQDRPVLGRSAVSNSPRGLLGSEEAEEAEARL
jgi:hypothetical protein